MIGNVTELCFLYLAPQLKEKKQWLGDQLTGAAPQFADEGEI